MKFDYYKFPLPKKSDFFGSSVLRPIIPISISTDSYPVRYLALIDSGADFCIFDAEIGEVIGLDVKSGKLETFSGIQPGKPTECYLHEVTINIGGHNYKTIVAFSYHISTKGYGILGQKGFFDLFKVSFEYQKERIEIQEKRG